MNPLPILLALTLLLILPPISSAALSVPLTVTDYSGTARTLDPLTSGVPLPESAGITSTSQLRVTDSAGTPIPAQFTVMARWNGIPTDSSKPIKWVLLDFQASTAASGTSIYYLKDGGPFSFTSQLSVQDQTGMITVTTGKAKFQISKNHFNLFDYVWIDRDGDGLDDPIVSSPGQGGAVLTDANGKQFFTNLEAPESITIEETGTMRMAINIRGVFKAADGSYFAPSLHNPSTYPHFNQPYAKSFVYYNARIYFYNNKDYAKVSFTLEQNGAQGSRAPETCSAPRQAIWFKSLNLPLSLNSTISEVSSEDGQIPLSQGENFSLWQSWRENTNPDPTDFLSLLVPGFDEGIYYTVKKGNSVLYTGKTNPGWVETNAGFGIAAKDFWQNFHKKITVDSSKVTLGLWPEGGYYPFDTKRRDEQVYYISGGRHKTHDFLLNFGSNTRQASQALQKPLMALAAPDWYSQTGALGLIAPGNPDSADPVIKEALSRYDRQQKSLVLEGSSDNGITALNARMAVQDASIESRRWRYWGWMNFGDFVFMNTYEDGHYDFPYGILLQYLRTGERSFFDLGAEMSRTRYDIDQYHGERTDTSGNKQHIWANHWQRFSEGDLHSWFPDSGPSFLEQTYGEGDEIPKPYYSWNEGPILYYLLTGDRKSLETAQETGQGLLAYYGNGGVRDVSSPSCTNGGLLEQTRSIVMAVNLYRLNGDSRYIDIARNITKNVLLYREQQIGGRGIFSYADSHETNTYALQGKFQCVISGCGCCANVEFWRYDDYESLINVHLETNDTEIMALIIRIADFLKNKGITGGQTLPGGQYDPVGMSQYWVEEDPDGSIRGQKRDLTQSVIYSDLLAYAYKLTGDMDYLTKARTVFKDEMFYGPSGGFISPVSPGFRYLQSYKSYSTREHATLSTYGQVYLNAEWGAVSPLTITTSSLPSAALSSAYSQPLSAMGGTSPYTWSLITGSLPAGLSLSPTGLISGTPTATGTYTFTVQARDSDSPQSTATRQLSITVSQTVDNPPGRSSGSPSGTLSAGTTTATLSLSTSEPATCRHSTTSGTAYASMTSTFSGSGTTSHSTSVSVQDGVSYNYYVRCQDTAGNPNTDDYPISFSVSSPTPVQTGCRASLVLLHHYDSSLSDSSGNGNSGTCTNCPVFTTGRFSQAASFDGTDDYVQVPNSPSIQFNGQAFSVSAWVKPTDTAYLSHNIVQKDNMNSGSEFPWTLYHYGSTVYFKVLDTSTAREVSASSSVSISEYRHIAATFDPAGYMRLYINGEQKGSLDVSGFTFDSSSGTYPLRIGTLSYTLTPYTYFNGMIDELSIWNRALSASEIQALYTSGPVICFHKSDTDSSGCVSDIELTTFIGRWKVNSSDPTLKELMEAIGLWKTGSC